jgi:alkanesulfonate monooxygenase
VHLLWFIPSFGDESRLGDVSTHVPPTLGHLTAVARAAEDAGFEGVLVPAGEACHDGWTVLSGYRHDEEAERVGRHLMPLL